MLSCEHQAGKRFTVTPYEEPYIYLEVFWFDKSHEYVIWSEDSFLPRGDMKTREGLEAS